MIFFLLTTNDQNDHQRQIIADNDSGEDTGDGGSVVTSFADGNRSISDIVSFL